MIKPLYSAATYLATPALLGYLAWRSRREPAYRQYMGERFGLRGPSAPRDALWIHAASVGEVQAMSALVRACQQRYPERPIVISTMTPSGADHVRRLFGTAVSAVLLPFDQPHAMRHFVRQLSPRLAVIMEMEWWPNLFGCLRADAVPVVMANARLSERSARRYRRLPGLMREMLGTPRVISAQTRADADRLIRLGAPGDRVVVDGNLKFDASGSMDRESARGLRHDIGSARPVWIAASTRGNEEPAVLDAFRMIQKDHPDLLLLLAPRHADRFDEVEHLCQARGLRLARRSRDSAGMADAEVLLADTLGELPWLYGAADVAFVGGSLVPLGGQNMLEPAAWGLPVVLGPHTFNFTEVVKQLTAAGAAESVSNAAELARTVSRLLSDPQERANGGGRAQSLVARHAGAGERLLSRLGPLLRGDR